MKSVWLALSEYFTHLQEITTIKRECNPIEQLPLILDSYILEESRMFILREIASIIETFTIIQSIQPTPCGKLP
jgi:hypothetical protein